MFESSHSASMNEIFSALSKAQATISTATKDKANPYFNSRYADLASVWAACRQPLSENGLSIVQVVGGSAQDMHLTTILGHTSGQWISSCLPLLLVKKDPQAQGSAITYARRYGLAAMVGISPEDDDGNAATHEKEPDKYAKKHHNGKVSVETVPAKQAQDLIKKATENMTVKTAVRKISVEDLDYILSLIDDDQEYLGKILKHFSITKLSDLPDEKVKGLIASVKTRDEERKKSELATAEKGGMPWNNG